MSGGESVSLDLQFLRRGLAWVTSSNRAGYGVALGSATEGVLWNLVSAGGVRVHACPCVSVPWLVGLRTHSSLSLERFPVQSYEGLPVSSLARPKAVVKTGGSGGWQWRLVNGNTVLWGGG